MSRKDSQVIAMRRDNKLLDVVCYGGFDDL